MMKGRGAFWRSDGSFARSRANPLLPKVPLMSNAIKRWCRILLPCFLLAATLQPVIAADPTFVGVLALAIEDDVAREIGLTPEVHDKLKKLVARRENEAVDFVLQIRELPPEIRAERIREYATKIEREGLALLSLEQRSKLEQIRIRRKGMDTLVEPNMVKILQLTPDQQKEIKRLRLERRRKASTVGERERLAIGNEYERKLRAVLTPAQQALWDQLAGHAGVPVAQAPSAPAKKDDSSASSEKPASKEGSEKTAPPASPTPMPETPAEPSVEPRPSEGAAMKKPDKVAKSDSSAQTATTNKPEASPSDVATRPVKLRFQFRYQPWKDVLEWLAEQADLSLQVDVYPEGTFNYSDRREYTPEEAIDLINGVLVTKGYTLLRRGRLLTVLNLDSETPIPDILVEFVPVEKLPERGEFELVKTIFQLARLDPTELRPEIEPLIGPGRTMVVMPKSRQILVTGTAGKLRLIKEIIDRAENPGSGDSGAMTTIELQHATAEEVIAIARPLLGLEEESTRNEDIQIATDNLGTRLFVTGKPDKIELLRDIVQRVDQARGGEATTAVEQPQLLTYQIRAADPETVHAVLSTLLAGLPDVRLAVDQTNRKLIALARPSEHKTIVETLRQLEGEAPRFEVIPLKRIDAQTALAVVQNFFGSGESSEGEGEGAATSTGPVVEADPTLNKLFVRGTATQIEQIKQMLQSLEEATAATGEGKIRLIPLPPEDAAQALEQLKRFWPGDNPIRILVPGGTSRGSRFEFRTPAAGERSQPSERREGTEAPSPTGKKSEGGNDKSASEGPMFGRHDMMVAFQQPGDADSSGATEETLENQSTGAGTSESSKAAPEIRVEITDNGVLVYCDDEEALDRFEQLLRTLTGPTSGLMQRKFTVFFLKHAKAEAALQLLQDILGGGSSGSAGSLISDMASGLLGGGGGLLGAVMGAATGGGGSSNTSVATVQGVGPISIVADPRLNALIVQAVPADVRMLDDLLKVIDREDSVTPVETAGRPRAIPVQYIPAEDAARIIREAFADRVAGGQQGQQRQQPNPVELIRALRGGGRGGSNRQNRGELPKMTVAVDSRSNSVIVTAPEQLFKQVEALVREIDRPVPESTDQVDVVMLKTTDAEVVRQALANILGGTGTSSTSSSSSSGGSTTRQGTPSPGTPRFDPEAIRRRIEFFRQLQQGRGGGGPGGRPGASRPGRPSPSGSGRSGRRGR